MFLSLRNNDRDSKPQKLSLANLKKHDKLSNKHGPSVRMISRDCNDKDIRSDCATAQGSRRRRSAENRKERKLANTRQESKSWQPEHRHEEKLLIREQIYELPVLQSDARGPKLLRSHGYAFTNSRENKPLISTHYIPNVRTSDKFVMLPEGLNTAEQLNYLVRGQDNSDTKPHPNTSIAGPLTRHRRPHIGAEPCYNYAFSSTQEWVGQQSSMKHKNRSMLAVAAFSLPVVHQSASTEIYPSIVTEEASLTLPLEPGRPNSDVLRAVDPSWRRGFDKRYNFVPASYTEPTLKDVKGERKGERIVEYNPSNSNKEVYQGGAD